MYKGQLMPDSFPGCGPKRIPVPHFSDQRGALTVLDDASRRADGVSEHEFVLDLFVQSPAANTLRGLHFQRPPYGQAMQVHVVAGRIWDVVLDLRRGSATYGEARATELAAGGGEMLFVPEGFAHGYLTREPDTHIFYKLSKEYAPGHEGGVLWSDPELNIPWPIDASGGPVLSGKDRALPEMRDLEPCFKMIGGKRSCEPG